MTDVTMETFEQEVIDADKLVLVDFWAEWCGPCKMMAPVLEKMQELYVNNIKIVKVNVDMNSKMAEKFNIRGIPSVLFFMNGKQLETSIVGFKNEDQVRAIIDKTLQSDLVLF